MTSEKRLLLIKQKQWIIPADEQTYAELRGLGISHTRLHVDVFDTLLDLKIKPAGIAGSVKKFDTVWNPFLEKVHAAWKRTPSTKFQNDHSSIRMDTTHSGVYEEIKNKVERIEACFDRFFTRWGSAWTFEHSESHGRHRISVGFRHGARPPVIALAPDLAGKEAPIVIDFGNTRVLITDDDSGLAGSTNLRQLEVLTKAGIEYKSIWRSRFLPQSFDITPEALSFLISNGVSRP